MAKKVKELPGRPRQFDHDAILAQITQVFWRQGFAKTTYADLEEATGLHRQSLVYAFGDKKALFESAIDYYAATRVQRTLDQLQAPGSPLKNIYSVLNSWVEEAEREIVTGCLFVNTSGELGQSMPALTQKINASNQKVVDALQKTIQAAQAQGEIVSELDPADLAHQILATGDGVLSRSRVSSDSSFAQAATRSLLAMIDYRGRHNGL